MMARLSPQDVVRLPRGVRLRFDAVRNAHVLLAPERAFDVNDVAVAVLELVDGRRSIAEIAVELATRFEADRATVEADVTEMLADLVGKRILEAEPGAATER
jgi:pyrroloquinoline quinone biosynthesis protein D